MLTHKIYIDVITSSRMEGWAWNPSEANSVSELTLYSRGRIVGTAICDAYRKDLEDAGIGNGKHAFRMIFTSHVDVSQDDLYLIVDGNEAYQVAHDADEVRLQQINLEKRGVNNLIIPSKRQENVYFDVSDLIFYWKHHRNVSGIQRVQLGYIKNLSKVKNRKNNISVCYRNIPDTTYYHLAASELSYLTALNESAKIPDDKWVEEISRFSISEKAPFEFEDGTLVVLGAPWVTPDYYEHLVRVKHQTSLRIVQLIYDLIPVARPDFCDQALVTQFSGFIEESLRIADAFLTISSHTKNELEQIFDQKCLPRRSMSVVKMGSDITPPAISTGRGSRSPKIKSLIREKYVLFVGTIEVRKNHRLTVDIWRHLIAEHEDSEVPNLIWVGRKGWMVDDLFMQLENSKWLNGKIIHISDATDADLEELYSNCMFTIFPSLYEGWGLPVSESLRHRKPCVASQNSSIPEAGGDCATYIDTDNLKSAIHAVEGLVFDMERRNELTARISETHEAITWEAASRDLLDKINNIIEEDSERSAVVYVSGMRVSVDCIPTIKLKHKMALGEELQVLTSGAHAVLRHIFFGEDWFGHESWGRWSAGGAARLLFAFVKPVDRRIVLLSKLVVPPWYSQCRAEVFINEHKVGVTQISGTPNILKVTIDPKTLIYTHDRAVALLTVKLDRTVPPPENEKRNLGVGIFDLFACDETDISARLSYIEALSGIKLLEA